MLGQREARGGWNAVELEQSHRASWIRQHGHLGVCFNENEKLWKSFNEGSDMFLFLKITSCSVKQQRKEGS